MIKIRYSDLSPGLHASAEVEGKHTVICLVPGLSSADRRNAIGRLRASARVGRGPKIPALPLGIALISDRARVTVRNATAAARLHPAGVAIPVAVLAVGAILYGLFVTVSLRIGPPSGTNSLELPLPLTTRAASHRPGPTPVSGRPPGPVTAVPMSRGGAPGPAGHSGAAAPGGHQGQGSSPTPTTGPTPSLSPTASSSPPVHPSPPPTSASQAPPPTPTPTPTRSHGAGGGPCLHLLGVVGICL